MKDTTATAETKYYHVIRGGRLLRGMFATEWRAKRVAAQYPGAIVVKAAGRVELKRLGYITDWKTQ